MPSRFRLGKLVTEDDLMDQVWPGLNVGENTIQVHVSALRKALGEDTGGQRFIVTVPGRGYRFVAGTAERVRSAEPDAGPGLALPDKPSIAVLPFQNMSGDPRAGVLRRWHGRRHHHRAVAHALAVRDRPQFDLHLQRPQRSTSGRSAASSACATCSKAAFARPGTGCASPDS